MTSLSQMASLYISPARTIIQESNSKTARKKKMQMPVIAALLIHVYWVPKSVCA